MIEADDIRDQMLTLCNLVSQDRPDAVLSQSCALVASTLQARVAVLMLLDGTGQSFVTGAGVFEGDATWAPEMISLRIEAGDNGQTPWSQVALTGCNLCIRVGQPGYNLNSISGLLPKFSERSEICFIPMHNDRSELVGVYVVAGKYTMPEQVRSTDLTLILRAISARIDQCRKQRTADQHIRAMERSLSLADRQRSELRELARSTLQAQLPGTSAEMKMLRRQVERLSEFTGPVLITGEDGTDKERVAREIHRLSRRANTPFVYVNCATLNGYNFASELFGHKRGAIQGVASGRRGVLREAGKGVVYFDRIDLLLTEVQVVLSRVINTGQWRALGSEREVPLAARIISSVPPLENLKNSLNATLLHSISQAGITVPPLRARLEDIEVLAYDYLMTIAQERRQRLSFDEGCIAHLIAQNWPGNAHELRGVILRASHLTEDDGKITPEMLGRKTQNKGVFPQDQGLRASLETYEATLIKLALGRVNNNRAQAAKNLGIPKRTLADKCLRYGL